MSGKRAQHPGKILKRKFLDPLGITPYRLAKGMGVHVRRISEIIKGNRSITPDTAIRLGLYFDVPARWWLDMQARYDSEDNLLIDKLRRIVTPYDKMEEILVTPKGVRLLRLSEDRKIQVEYMVVSKETLERLKARVKLCGPKAEREAERVVYGNGSQALVGSDK